MPEVDGLAFAKWVRSKPQFKDLPMIAMSGNTRPSMDGEAMKAGFTKFMRKFDPAELKAVLFEMCSARSRKGVSA
jgi:CheY-like chemotaxis protein